MQFKSKRYLFVILALFQLCETGKSKKIMLGAMPFVGHAVPLVYLAEEFVRRGHEVCYYLPHTGVTELTRLSQNKTYVDSSTNLSDINEQVDGIFTRMRDAATELGMFVVFHEEVYPYAGPLAV